MRNHNSLEKMESRSFSSRARKLSTDLENVSRFPVKVDGYAQPGTKYRLCKDICITLGMKPLIKGMKSGRIWVPYQARSIT